MIFSLDDREIEARDGETIWAAAQRAGVSIPALCHKPGYTPAGNCRACVVEVEGERVLAASCCRAVQPGMKVQAQSVRAVRAQKSVVELLLAAAGETRALKHDSELAHWADRLGAQPRYARRIKAPPPDRSHPAMTVDLSACIQCTRCVRACRSEQVNDVIGMSGRGAGEAIVFDQGDPMGASTCVACGECVQACPTGAIAPANGSYARPSERQVDSVCPYCGVGCQLTYHVAEGENGDRIVRVEGRDGIANASRLCVKGRFGYDYIHHPHRLTRPLIRREDAPAKGLNVDPADFRSGKVDDVRVDAGLRESHPR